MSQPPPIWDPDEIEAQMILETLARALAERRAKGKGSTSPAAGA
jgi:hypothetical protein